jgi:hypothetical protein
MLPNPREFNWVALAEKIGARQRGGIDVGRRAIIELLGEPLLEAAVDFYIGYPDGFAVAQSILDLLRPEVCLRRCLEIYTGETEPGRRQGAVELLTTVGDASTLPWIEKFLNDEDEVIQNLGTDVLDQLVWGERVEPSDAEKYIRAAEASRNPTVLQKVKRIRDYLDQRAKL